MNVTTTRAPRARKNDPQESHDAAAAVDSWRSGLIKRNIIRTLADAGRGLHDEALVARYKLRYPLPHATDSGIRSRRAELVKVGAVLRTERRQLTAAGRPTRVWEVNLDDATVQAVLATPEADQ